MDNRTFKKDLEEINRKLNYIESWAYDARMTINDLQEKIIDNEEDRINLWFDKIRHSVLTKSA